MASERDDLAVQILERIERPVEPDPEFADALRSLLLADLTEPRPSIGNRLRLRPLPRWRMLAPAAAALAVVAVGIGVFLAVRVEEESALAAIRQAQRRAVGAPSFRAVVSHRVAGELGLGTVALATGADWVSVLELSYGDDRRWRRTVLRESFSASSRSVAWDGRALGIDRPEQRRYYLYPREGARRRDAVQQLSPLATLRPRFRLFPVPASVSAETYFRESCRVGPDGEVAGRPARRLTCGDRDFRFSLWLDRATGLLLRLEAPGDVLEVRRIEYGVRFAPSTFRVQPPSNATVVELGDRRG